MNIPLTHAAEGLERRAFMVADVLAMVEAGILARNERFELIGGEIVPMSPKGIRHEIIKQWLNKKLVFNLVEGLDTIPETTFYLADDTFIESDFVIYPSGELEKLNPENCKLAIEIADSSRSYDLGRKAKLYAEFGITELWVIDVNSRSTHVHLNPQDGIYTSVQEMQTDEDVVPQNIPGLVLNLKDFK